MFKGGSSSLEYEDTLREFRAFLREHQAALHRPTTLALLASHGREADLLFFCDLVGDHERIVTHLLQRQQYAEALDALSCMRHPGPDGKAVSDSDAITATFADLWYRHATVLLHHEPAETVQAWREAGQAVLDPLKLLPALVRYEQVGVLGCCDGRVSPYMLTSCCAVR
jgi:vacuolar protein sorting-associated protein 18